MASGSPVSQSGEVRLWARAGVNRNSPPVPWPLSLLLQFWQKRSQMCADWLPLGPQLQLWGVGPLSWQTWAILRVKPRPLGLEKPTRALTLSALGWESTAFHSGFAGSLTAFGSRFWTRCPRREAAPVARIASLPPLHPSTTQNQGLPCSWSCSGHNCHPPASCSFPAWIRAMRRRGTSCNNLHPDLDPHRNKRSGKAWEGRWQGKLRGWTQLRLRNLDHWPFFLVERKKQKEKLAIWSQSNQKTFSVLQSPLLSAWRKSVPTDPGCWSGMRGPTLMLWTRQLSADGFAKAADEALKHRTLVLLGCYISVPPATCQSP